MRKKTIPLQAEFAMELAVDAGSIISHDFSMHVKKELKPDNTFVTGTDLKINNMVIKEISKRYPNHNILAEEYSLAAKASEYTWVCDPIDGTISFSHGIPTAVFSLALVRSGRPILGVVYDPFQDRLFLGMYGKGATLNDKKISVSSDKKVRGSIIGFAAWQDAQEDITNAYPKMIKEGASVLMLGSITYMGALVAAGELSACVHPARMPFDTAAVKVIIEEAGGKVTGLNGKKQRYNNRINGAIMSNGRLHDSLVSIVRS